MEPTGTSFAIAAWPQHPAAVLPHPDRGVRMTVIEQTRSTDGAVSEQNCSPHRARYSAVAAPYSSHRRSSDLSFQVTQ
jgi:hypothetical protein